MKEVRYLINFSFSKIIPAFFLLCGCLFLLQSCNVTRNLPEDEILYRGIEKLEFGKQPNREAEKEGVITALNNAYNTMEDLFTGDGVLPKLSEAERKDSLRKADQIDEENYQAARSEVEAVLAYAPNAALMGSSYITHPFSLRLWLYNKYVNSESRFGQWMMNHFAATPVYVSKVNPLVRTTVAHNTLRNFGYFRNQVSYQIVPQKDSRKAKISYHVSPGPLFHLDSIAYQYFPVQADSIIRATQIRSLLKRGNPFSVKDLDAERTRLSDAFRNQGYYFFRPDYVTFRADTVQAQEKVSLQVRPSTKAPEESMRPYYLGNTTIRVYRQGEWKDVDSTSYEGFTYVYSVNEKYPPVRFAALRSQLFYRQGDLYRQFTEQLIQQKLSAMNIFSSLRVTYEPRDSVPGKDTLDVNITAILDKPYDAEFQGHVAAKSNGQLGPGVNFSMSRYNAFRGAETVRLQAWGSYEWQTGANLPQKRSLLNSYEYGASFSLLFPRMMFFGVGKSLNRRFVSQTEFTLDTRWLSRAGYFTRVSMGAGMKYTLQRRRNIRHEITPLVVDYDQLLSSSAIFDSIVTANQALYASMRDQFVPAMEYTYTWQSIRHHQRTLKLHVREAGNVTSAIYAITGQSFKRRDKELFSVPFAQFIKGTAQYTHLFPLGHGMYLATRAFGGVVYSYGNARSAPYSDLFSIGGANSIRAFSIRSIGPGAYHPENSSYSYIDEMGDLKLEANVEFRFPIIAQLHGAVFLDAGNVWLIRSSDGQPGGQFRLNRLGRDIALGTGAGIRYDLDFLVLRFDVGIGLHAPYDTGHSGYYNMPKFGKSLGYHFAIGYPF